MQIYFFEYFFTAVTLFVFSCIGIFSARYHTIAILIALELMLLSLNLSLLCGSLFHDDILGQVFILFVLTVAAAEATIGLAILVVYYRIRGVISLDFISSLKGLLNNVVDFYFCTFFEFCCRFFWRSYFWF